MVLLVGGELRLVKKPRGEEVVVLVDGGGNDATGDDGDLQSEGNGVRLCCRTTRCDVGPPEGRTVENSNGATRVAGNIQRWQSQVNHGHQSLKTLGRQRYRDEARL